MNMNELLSALEDEHDIDGEEDDFNIDTIKQMA